MSTAVIELAFEQMVDLLTETCAACGLVLGLSTEQVGTVGTTEAGLPVARVWHLSCAPVALRAAYRVSSR